MELNELKNKLKDIFLKDKMTIDEDKIKELFDSNKVLLDETSARELANIFIVYGIPFKSKPVGNMCEISLEYEDTQLKQKYNKLVFNHNVLIDVLSEIHKIINEEKDCKIAFNDIKKVIKNLYGE